MEQPPEKKQGSWISFLLVGLLTVIVLAGLFVLTLGYIGPVIAIGVGIFAVAALHYVVWGWWLSKIIHDEEAKASADRDDRSDWSESGRKP